VAECSEPLAVRRACRTRWARGLGLGSAERGEAGLISAIRRARLVGLEDAGGWQFTPEH
jgi:hypothetical protein